MLEPHSGDATDEPAETWAADSAHAEISFSVNDFFTPVRGTFRDFEIDLDYGAENPENSRVETRPS